MPEKTKRESDEKQNFEESLLNGDKPSKAKGEAGLTPEIVERIENLMVDPYTKVNLLTVIAGLKPAAFIGFESTINLLEIEEIGSFIKDTSLKFEIKNRKKKIDGTIPKELNFKDIIIAKNKKTLNILDRALNNDDEESLGLAIGFPKTAVEAYLGKRKRLNKNTLPEEVRKSDAVRFCKFILSADNWHNEIEQGQKYANLVKEVSPNTYYEFLTISEVVEQTEGR